MANRLSSLWVSSLFLMALAVPAVAHAQIESVTPGTLQASSTIQSIGLEWRVLNDADHDAVARVDYRPSGSSAWKTALPLIRVDANGVNMLAGSVLFLAPDTSYDVRVALTDPDGGGETRTTTVRTRRLPSAPAAGRILHVVPGSGGGDGTPSAPFGGIVAAQDAAQPGDTVLLHAGAYGGRISFEKPGTASAYIAWKAAGDGEVELAGIEVAGSHIWLEGLTVRNLDFALLSLNSPTNVVVSRCRLLNNHYGIFLRGAGTNWYIADNTIVGDTPAASESLSGEGIDLNTTSGHTVAHNSITNVADGISYPYSNVDIYGNDIFDTSDDGIELDYGSANVRVWANRIHNAVHNGISFQPQAGAPWYLVRNQIVGNAESAFKFRTTDRFVLLHNTIVNWGDAWPGSSLMCCNEWDLLRAFARNNLWITAKPASEGGAQIWGFETYTRDWRSDLDYDAFDWGPSVEPFTYGGMVFPDVGSFASASGLELNGIAISKDDCFTDFRMSAPSPNPVPSHLLTLKSGCRAIDSGAVLPGINDDFIGTGPDRGAHEYGATPTAYGPRSPLPVPPLPPSDLTASASTTSITVEWHDNSSNEDGFRIERSASGGPFTLVANTAMNSSRYVDSTAVPVTTYTYRVASLNQAGSSPYSNTASAAIPPTAGAVDEVVLYAAAASAHPGWTVTADATAAGGARLQNANAGAAKLTTPLITPSAYFDLTFTADAGKPYHLWIRGKAISNSWTNDSAFVQFDHSVTAAGAAVYRIGTTSATTYTLEDCSGCGLAGWGWQDNAYGTGALGPAIYFKSSGQQRLRVQVREDGLGIDQIVLSARTYLSKSPGTTQNDTTILTAPDVVNMAPTTRLTGPAANAQFTAPATIALAADASDSDGMVTRVEFLANGASVGARTAPPWTFTWTGVAAGSYSLSARATDNRGGTATSASVPVAVTAPAAIDEVVLYAAAASAHPGWTVTADATAAGGARLQNANAGAAKLTTPLITPSAYFDLTFTADAGKPYHLWIRGKATNNSWTNDSAFVQFDQSVTAAGAAVYRIGTTSATTYTLEDCSGCGLAGWGWQDNAYGTGALGPAIYFKSSGQQRLRVQVREDGLGIDQIVLSARTYLSKSPGTTQSDTTILR